MLSRRIFIAAAMLTHSAGLALGAGAKPRGADHERARQAFQRGEIRSLSAILVELKSQIAGEVIEVDLVRTKTGYIYKFKVLQPDGQVRDVVVNAASGKVLSSEAD